MDILRLKRLTLLQREVASRLLRQNIACWMSNLRYPTMLLVTRSRVFVAVKCARHYPGPRDNYTYDSRFLRLSSRQTQRKMPSGLSTAEKEKGCEGITIIQSTVGPVIGSHVGPGMVAVVFWGTDRREKLSCR